MANPWNFTTLRPAFVLEDYYDTVTVDGTGSIAAWTLEAELYDAAGNVVATPTVEILDAAARTVLVSITGEDFSTAADYTLVLRRTDAPDRTVVATGTLEVVNPNANAWGAGFAL